MNSALFDWINELAGHSAVIDDPARWAAQYLIFALGLITAGSWFVSQDAERPPLLQAALSVIIAMAFVILIQRWYEQPRPFVERGDVHLLVSHGADPSFPSEHVAIAAAAAGSFLWNRRVLGVPLLIGATLLGLARVYVGIHYPADVVAALAIGLAASYAVAAAGGPIDGMQRSLTRRLPPPLR